MKPFHHLALIFALVCCTSINAQEPASTTAKAQDAQLREKAFSLLASLADQTPTLQSGENRARMASNIAGSLWEHDEGRARALFLLVKDEVNAGLQSDNEEASSGRQLSFAVFLQLRADTLERIAKHDPELALTFLQGTTPPAERRPYDYDQKERVIEVRLAKQIAANNPELALKLGRQSLARGFSEDIVPLLWRLQRKHREHALTLYKEAVAKLRNTDLEAEWDAKNFALRLTRAFSPPPLAHAEFRELISMLMTSALTNGCVEKHNQYSRQCREVAGILPYMEVVDPLRAARLKHLGSNETDLSTAQGYHELSEVAESGSVDEILALAPHYPDLKFDIYHRAMLKARRTGDLERARKIADSFNGDPERQAEMVGQLEREEKWTKIDDERLAEIQKSVNQQRGLERRVGLLGSTAYGLSQTDRANAIKLLDQASDLIDTMKPGKEQTEYQLFLALTYCLAKSDRGLTIMGSLMPRLNELVTAAAKLDGFDTNYLSQGEWNMSAGGKLGELLSQLADFAGAFAHMDFDRAVSLAAQFERAELSMMAQLKLAQGALSDPRKLYHQGR